MKGTRKIILWTAGLTAIACGAIAVVVLFRGDGITTQYEAEYPELDTNEKLDDISFGWYRPLRPGGPLKFKFVGRFPKMPDKMLVYKILRPQNVTEAYVRELAQKYFDMPADANFERSTNMYWLNTESYLFEFDASTGFFNIFKYKKARKKLSEDRKDYPGDEECKKIATEYLKKRGLMPEDAYLRIVYDDNIESVGAMSVCFRRKIGQYKSWGPGSEILVRIGVDGEITKVSKRWSEYEPYKLAPIRSPKEAFEQLKYGRVLLMISLTSSGKVTKIELGYDMPPEGDYIQPVYRFGFDRPRDYALVPAIKQEYLKSTEEMLKEIKEERSRSK